MDELKILAQRFEADRPHLQGVAYRMLGSLSEADDAVQEAWLRLNRSDTSGVENLSGWLTTVVARVCLDMLRSRKARREESLDAQVIEPPARRTGGGDPAQEVLLADSVGLALLVVLERLAPAERIAFVLHDLFDLPFDEIAPIVGRSSTAARQLASRARRRVRGGDTVSDSHHSPQRTIVQAFLTAARGGDLNTLLSLLDPEVVFRADKTAAAAGGKEEIRGAEAVAGVFVGRAQAARPALIEGVWGVVVAPRGHLLLVMEVTIKDGQITALHAVADPARLSEMDLAVVSE